MDDKYEKLIRELKEEAEMSVRYGGDISWTIQSKIEELSKDDLLEILKSIAAKFIEKEIENSI